MEMVQVDVPGDFADPEFLYLQPTGKKGQNLPLAGFPVPDG